MSFAAAGINIEFQGAERSEVGINTDTGDTILRINPAFYRPAEVELLIGDASKARDMLNWLPATDLELLCKMMVAADLERQSGDVSSA
jgi:GDPmannose 4,6-dehydratase